MDEVLAALAGVLQEGLVVAQIEPSTDASGGTWTIVCCNAAAARILNVASGCDGQPLSVAFGLGPWSALAPALAACRDGALSSTVLLAQSVPPYDPIQVRVSPVCGMAALVIAAPQPNAREAAADAFARKMDCASRICGRVGHDVNNLLTGILGYAELAEDAAASGGDPTEYLDRVQELVEKAAEFTGDLMLMASRSVSEPRVVDLGAHLEGARALIAAAAGPHIRVAMATPGAPLMVRAHSSGLNRVFLELAENAGQASGEHGALEITLDVLDVPEAMYDGPVQISSGRYARITFADGGRGMLPGVRARLFEPFFTTRDGVKTAGHGLGVAFGIVRQMGGYLAAAESEKGATFRIYLPAPIS